MLIARVICAASCFASSLLVVPQVANAFAIDSTTPSQSFEVSWELLGSDPGNPVAMDLSGTATFDYRGIETDGSTQYLRFGLTLENTTPVSATTGGYSDIGLAAFGFGTDANFSLVSWGTPSTNLGSSGGGTSSPDGGTSGSSRNNEIRDVIRLDASDDFGPLDPEYPDLNDPQVENGIARLEECKDEDGNVLDEEECVKLLAVTDSLDVNGSGTSIDNGLSAGASDSFEFVLALNDVISPTTQINIDPFAVAYRYNDPNGGEGEVRLAANENDANRARLSAAQVPVPGSLLLFGLGAVLLARLRRYRG